MSLPTALLNPQTSKLFSLFPNSQFLLSPTPSPYPSPRTLAFPRKSPTLSTSLHFSPQYQQESSSSYSSYDGEEEEHVVGDCVVFEEGAFEDPYLYQTFDSDSHSDSNFPKKNNSKLKVEVKPEDLVPEKWKEAQVEINITKKQKRAMAREMEFGRKVEKRKQGLVPIRGVTTEDYLAFRNEKLAQLKPIVLDNPRFGDGDGEGEGEGEGKKEGGGEERGGERRSSRVTPRNPRLAVYGGTLDDISEFFSSGSYDPNAAQNPGGPRKLFTKEQKVLLNMRIPELSAATSDKWLPLHTLVAAGEFYLVNALLKYNGDINIKDKDGQTALHKAVISKKQAVFNYLLRESANPFVRDKEGATLMHYAVRTSSSPMIKILLLYNVDINLQDNDGWTPLHLAVQTRRTDIVRLLLIKGADKTLKNQDGLTPLDLCLYSGHDTRTYELIKMMKQLPMPRRSFD